MHYISLAENAHDYCLTLANDKKLILHLEVEEFLTLSVTDLIKAPHCSQ